MIQPGETVGVIGGGQLGRMLALEGRRMGYRVAVLDPDPLGPAAQVADVVVAAPLDSLDGARQLAQLARVVTIETEHVAPEVLSAVERAGLSVFPSSGSLATLQDRLSQRRFLEGLGLPQPRFAPIDAPEEVPRALEVVGLPAVLKTRRGGYDGRGQAKVTSEDEAAAAVRRLGPALIAESFVPFEQEVSLLVARGASGELETYPLAANEHRRHILHMTVAPAPVSPAVAEGARAIGAAVAGALGERGMLCVELFLLGDGSLQINELAPRVHNSGHFTWGACVTSQFEQHLRAICGAPLGSPAQLTPAVMVNLLGELWAHGPPRWHAAFSMGATLHLYGKRDARAGRKMGHLLLTGTSATAPREVLGAGVDALLEQLGGASPTAADVL